MLQIFGIIISASALAISFYIYKLSVAQREDTWLRTLWDFQRAFWQDERMEQVRTWIACDKAYEDEIKSILIKRLGNLQKPLPTASALNAEEYKALETIDRFAALLVAYGRISPPISIRHTEVKYRLFDDYWLSRATEHNRTELKSYFQAFYPELLKKQ